MNIFFVPPVHFRHVVDAGSREPILVSQRREEMRAGELFLDFRESRVRHVVVVVMRNHDRVDEGQVVN